MAEPTLLPERLQYRPTKIELDESIEKAKATLLKKIKRSVYVYRVDCGGCNGCEIEIFGSITPVFDVERFGIKVVPSPRHADVLLYTGAVTRAMRMPALRAFEAAPDTKIVVSYGACGCTGGIFYDNYCVWGGTDKILPVDVYIPGCPPNPLNLVGTLVAYLTNKPIKLDDYNRPTMFYGKTVHELCERRKHFEAGEFAPSFNSEEARKGWCLYDLGCKGPSTYNNCPKALFNQTNWPVGAGHPCIGCSEPNFWDDMTPFYEN